MTWSLDAFESWFTTYFRSDAARARCRSAAAAVGRAGLADDLAQEWWLSVHTTIERVRRGSAALPAWLDSAECAQRYVLRALKHDAIDIARSRRREERFQSIGEAAEQFADPHPHESPSTPYEDTGIAFVELQDRLDAIADALCGLYRTGKYRCPGCGEYALPLMMGIIDRLRYPGRGDSTMPQHHQREGERFRSEWDELVYETLSLLAPERMVEPGGDPRRTAAARQFKSRCGRCARSTLQQLAREHL